MMLNNKAAGKNGLKDYDINGFQFFYGCCNFWGLTETYDNSVKMG